MRWSLELVALVDVPAIPPCDSPPPRRYSLPVHYINLETLVALKLASGMTNPGRLKDLADVQELIKIRKLPIEFANQLDPYVQGKFQELARSAQMSDDQRS